MLAELVIEDEAHRVGAKLLHRIGHASSSRTVGHSGEGCGAEYARSPCGEIAARVFGVKVLDAQRYTVGECVLKATAEHSPYSSRAARPCH